MRAKKIQRMATGMGHFFSFVGIEETDERTMLEETLINAFIRDDKKKPYVVHASNNLYYYNDGELIASNSVASESSDYIYYFNGIKIMQLNAEAYLK